MKTFRLLKAIAVLVSMLLLVWSTNFSASWFVSAASITSVSDTLSDSSPGSVSNHTIVFTTPTGISNGETITVDFSDGPFTGTSSITATDLDVQDGITDLSVSSDCTVGTEEVGISFTGAVLEIEFCPGDGASIAAGGSTTIEIGSHASFGGGGSNQLINPVPTGSYEIAIAGTQTDTGETEVVIIDTVSVTATVDTTFTFQVFGVGGGADVNGATTTGSSTPTALVFGNLEQGVASTTAQELRIVTNASQGYVVTVAQTQDFMSGNAIIDSFRNGEHTSAPISWESPAATPGQPTTFGHWGLTSDDATTTRSAEFGSDTWVAASTTPVVIMSHTGPTDGTGTGEGTTRVGYRVEISALQEAGNNYSTNLRYVATPIF